MPIPKDKTEIRLRSLILKCDDPRVAVDLARELNAYLTQKEKKLARRDRKRAKTTAPDAPARPDSDEPFEELDTTPAIPIPQEPTPEQRASILEDLGLKPKPQPKPQSAVALELSREVQSIENGLGWTRHLSAVTPLEVPNTEVNFGYRPSGPGDDRSSVGPNQPWTPWAADASLPVESQAMTRDPQTGAYEYSSAIQEREQREQEAARDAQNPFWLERNQPW